MEGSCFLILFRILIGLHWPGIPVIKLAHVGKESRWNQGYQSERFSRIRLLQHHSILTITIFSLCADKSRWILPAQMHSTCKYENDLFRYPQKSNALCINIRIDDQILTIQPFQSKVEKVSQSQ